MKSLGGNIARQYEAQVRVEIADKAYELEKIKKEAQGPDA